MARANPQRGGLLSVANLVPRPDPTRWQTTPEAPFQALRSEEARAALACCNLDSSIVDSQDQRGRPAYACSVGDTAIWRRQPLQNTLAFMLAKDEGRLFRVKATAHHRRREVAEQWLYCSTCHGTLFGSEENQGQCAVPFRDAANLSGVRGVAVPPGVLKRTTLGSAPPQTPLELILSAEES